MIRQDLPDDDCVMSFETWCEVNDFSKSTGQRLRKEGKGPRFIQTSDRRIGVTKGENRRWRESRALIEVGKPDA